MEGSAAGMAAAGMRGFPVVLTSFVGREQAVRAAAELCAGLLQACDDIRILATSGPGRWMRGSR